MFMQQGYVNPHQHEFYELVIVLKGKGKHLIDQEQYPISYGDVFMVHPGQIHGYEFTQNLLIVNLIYDPSQLGLPMADIKDLSGYHALFELEPKLRQRYGFKSKLTLDTEQLASIEKLLLQIEKEMNSKTPGYQFVCIATFMRIIAILSRCYSNIQSPEARNLVRIGETLSYMEKNYSRKITLSELAKMAGMSQCSLIRNFNFALGTSPIEYLLKLRLNKAGELLRNSDMNISETATATGFTDSNYFTRKFREFHRSSPRDFRKEWRTNRFS
jgi:AraC-like DNA-binding protein